MPGKSEQYVFISLLVVTAGMLILTALYAYLPDARQWKLFFPGCAFRAWLGIPCPFCGGSEAVAAALRGRWSEAWRANPFATLFLAGLPVAAASLLAASLYPRAATAWLKRRSVRLVLAGWCIVLLFAIVFFWIVRL